MGRTNRALWVMSVALLAALAAVARVPLARASEHGPVHLARPGTEGRWTATVPDGAVPDPALCTASTCSITEVVLAVGTDRLVVAVDTSALENTFDFLYDIQLHVYAPDGSLAASDDGSFESNVVVVDQPPAGTWRVVVLPQSVFGELEYRGYAAATDQPPTHAGPASAVRDLLPNLVAQPLTNLRLETAPLAGPPPAVWDARGQVTGPGSCYPQEMAEQGARRCLRFDQTVANLGEGPLELRARQVGDGAMDQRVHRSDGTVRDHAVGAVQLHLQHLHFHYEEYATVRLYDVGPGGRRGDLVREGRKQGFCLADTRNMRFGEPDQLRAHYVDPETCDGRDEAPGFSRVGITPGWADTYPWFILEQYIEISGLGDGRYEIEFSVNEAAALLEARYDDNRSTVMFDLRGDVVTVVPR